MECTIIILDFFVSAQKALTNKPIKKIRWIFSNFSCSDVPFHGNWFIWSCSWPIICHFSKFFKFLQDSQSPPSLFSHILARWCGPEIDPESITLFVISFWQWAPIQISLPILLYIWDYVIDIKIRFVLKYIIKFSSASIPLLLLSSPSLSSFSFDCSGRSTMPEPKLVCPHPIWRFSSWLISQQSKNEKLSKNESVLSEMRDTN